MIHPDDRDKWIPLYTNMLAQGSGSYVNYLGSVAFGEQEGAQRERIDVWFSRQLDAHHYVVWSPDYDENTPNADLTLEDYVVGSYAFEVWDEIVRMSYEGHSNAWQLVHHYLAEPEPWLAMLAARAGVQKMARSLGGAP